jgi:hypothetical protein
MVELLSPETTENAAFFYPPLGSENFIELLFSFYKN